MSANKRKGTAFEKRVVERATKAGLDARKQPGSGQYEGYPNDVVVANWLGECRSYTDHPSMTKFMEWLADVQANSVKDKREGSFLVYNQIGSRRPIVMLRLEDFLFLLANQMGNEG